jgi:hypothetical protein
MAAPINQPENDDATGAVLAGEGRARIKPIHLIDGYELTLSHLTMGIVPMGANTME